MTRRFLFLVFAVALVVGFTLPTFADTERPGGFGGSHDEDKFALVAKCTCEWNVTVKLDGYKEADVRCKEHYGKPGFVFKKFEAGEFKEIVVETKLKSPSFLSAYCRLDKELEEDNGYPRSHDYPEEEEEDDKPFNFSGACEVEFCRIDFKVFELKY